MESPDLAGSLTGYKVFLLNLRAGRLESPIIYNQWRPGVNEATCHLEYRYPGPSHMESLLTPSWPIRPETMPREHPPGKPIPAPNCECGIYAYKEPVKLPECLACEQNKRRGHELKVLGTLELWGRVEEHPDGYRSQFARISSLSVSNFKAKHLKALKAAASYYQAPLGP